MKDFYCLEIKFNENLDLNDWYHIHLKIDGRQIELQIFHPNELNFGTKFHNWVFNEKDYEKLCNYSTIKVSTKENDLISIDINNSKILKSSTNQIDSNNNIYFSIILDSISISKPPVEEFENTAKIYLNEQGFDLVKGYYSVFSRVENDIFDIQRMQGLENFYQLEKSKFRPEFEFSTSDNRNNRKPYIEKIPIINFNLDGELIEKDVLKYFQIACKITSFYLRIKIDFTQGEINLKDKRVLIFKTLKNQLNQEINSLNQFLEVRGTDGFLNLNWQQGFLKNQNKISRAIDNFVLARILDENVKLLVLFNTLEICMNGFSPQANKFKLEVTKKQKAKIYEEAFKGLKSTISSDDEEDFYKKWKNAEKNMVYKSMTHPIIQFLEKNNITIDKLKITVSRMTEIRGDIIHGSLEKIQKEELEETNIQLSKINIILIFNLLGIKNGRSNI